MSFMPFRSRVIPTSWARTLDRDFSYRQRSLDDIMDIFSGRTASSLPQSYFMISFPAINVKEKSDMYVLEADLPGISEDDLELDLHNNILTIKGERKPEVSNKNEGFTHIERYQGTFKKDIPFTDKLDERNIKARLERGVLRVELMKKEKGKLSHRKISIKR